MLYLSVTNIISALYDSGLQVRVMVFNATFNNISAISWRSVLLVEETENPEKTTDLQQFIDKLYHIAGVWNCYARLVQ